MLFYLHENKAALFLALIERHYGESQDRDTSYDFWVSTDLCNGVVRVLLPCKHQTGQVSLMSIKRVSLMQTSSNVA